MPMHNPNLLIMFIMAPSAHVTLVTRESGLHCQSLRIGWEAGTNHLGRHRLPPCCGTPAPLHGHRIRSGAHHSLQVSGVGQQAAL